jgi:NAD-dependent SIR2 family protein deacetylase
MKRTVLFTGAGASKAFGFPLTTEILPAVARLIDEDELFDEWPDGDKARRELKEWLYLLLPGYRPDVAKHVSITQLLSLVDHAIVSGLTLVPGRSAASLQRLRVLLEWAITETVWWPEEATAPGLSKLARWFLAKGGKPGANMSFITTNYDYSLEEELFKKYKRSYDGIARDFDFGFKWRHPDAEKTYGRPTAPKYQAYKLHGSLNWARCALCNHVYVNVDESPVYQLFGGREWTVGNSCHCGHWPLGPLLVAPSFVRDARDTNLLSIWDAAFEALRRADHWILVGYSLPPEDVAIRSLLLRAYRSRISEEDETDIQVYQLCNPETEAAYKLLFPDCDYRTTGMEGLIESLRA